MIGMRHCPAARGGERPDGRSHRTLARRAPPRRAGLDLGHRVRERSYRAPPLPPIPRSYDNKNMMILRGTLPVPLAQTAEGAPISSMFWGDRPSRKQIGDRMSLNAPLHHPIPYSPESEEADRPSVV